MEENNNRKLPNAPLQEVIFELLWEIDFDQLGNPVDQDYELAQGLFADKVRKDFPLRRRTMPEGAPIKIYPKTIHQFWKDHNVWPVVQLGPGILAVNETEHNYDWSSKFYPLIKKQIKNLEGSYGKELVYKNSSLRYIDAVEISEIDRQSILKYVNSKFNFSISNNFDLPGSVSHVNLTQTFDVDKDTKLSLIVNDGINKFKKPAIIWQTHIISNSRKNKEEIVSWVNKAHDLTSNLFKNIVNKDFYDGFK
ncbi:MAG: hypothetical protein ACI837_003217 [Crocinitomicaceae bacterium]|jgi:uncharacterized protein (TIGR04255 family)